LQNNLCNSPSSNLFKSGRAAVTRGNGFMIAKLPSILDTNKYCYHNRVVDIWNNRPFHVVSSQSIYAFKIWLGLSLARTPVRRRSTTARNPDLETMHSRIAGLQEYATTPGWLIG